MLEPLRLRRTAATRVLLAFIAACGSLCAQATWSVASGAPAPPSRVYVDTTSGHVGPLAGVPAGPARRMAPGAAPAPAGALDQAQDAFTPNEGLSISDVASVAQVFTAGAAGALTAVRVAAFSCVNWYLAPGVHPVGDLLVELRSLDASGLPSATVLATAVVAGSAVPPQAGWVTATFPAPAAVAAGTRYALVLRAAQPNACNFVWAGAPGGDVYGAGYLAVTFPTSGVPLLWIRHGESDQAFETFVAPLAPRTVDECTGDGWRRFTSPSFKNQGDCVSHAATEGKTK